MGVFSIWKSVCALLCPLFCSMVFWCARNDGDWVKNTEKALSPIVSMLYVVLLPLRLSASPARVASKFTDKVIESLRGSCAEASRENRCASG